MSSIIDPVIPKGYELTNELYAFHDLYNTTNYKVVFARCSFLEEPTRYDKSLYVIAHTELTSLWPANEIFGNDRVLTYKDLVPVKYEELSLHRLITRHEWQGYSHEVLCN